MSILETIKQWLITVCTLTEPPEWIGQFIDILACVILVVCIVMLCALVYHVLKWIFTLGGR